MTKTPKHRTGPCPETWTALLAHWTELASAAVAFPKTEEGDRWRASVPPIIELQALTHALGDLPHLAAGERAVGIDRAAVGIRRAAATIHTAWAGIPLPDGLAEIIADARQIHEHAGGLGRAWLVGPERLDMPDPWPIGLALVEAGFSGDMLAAAPGTMLFRGTPALFVRPEPTVAIAVDGLAATDRAVGACQVYRQVDDDGRPVRDLVTGMDALPPGRPLLQPVIVHGTLRAAPTDIETAQWIAAQTAALGSRALPVAVDGEDVTR